MYAESFDDVLEFASYGNMDYLLLNEFKDENFPKEDIRRLHAAGIFPSLAKRGKKYVSPDNSSEQGYESRESLHFFVQKNDKNTEIITTMLKNSTQFVVYCLDLFTKDLQTSAPSLDYIIARSHKADTPTKWFPMESLDEYTDPESLLFWDDEDYCNLSSVLTMECYYVCVTSTAFDECNIIDAILGCGFVKPPPSQKGKRKYDMCM